MGINEGNKTQISKVRGLSSGNDENDPCKHWWGLTLCFWTHIENVGYTRSTDLF
jgi:hypothetical protein